ncbi:MAG: integrase core domain-containing protein [Atribacterota bacterium]|nr:integrase core domain-containing protein [Atribacterota bacterium]
MKRKKSLSVTERNQPVLSFIQSIKAEHPFWGYRRCWAYLYYRQGLMVNKKRIYRLMNHCSTLGIKQIFTSWSNPKGNADTERVIRTLKEDLIWPYDWDNPFDFQRALGKWVDNYNQDFPHQALDYRTPCEYYQNYVKNKEQVLT